MTADRWQRIQGVFEQATALPPAERATFLAQACHGDKELRGEVESLLEHDAEAAKTGFLRSFDHPPKPGPQEDAGESDRMLPPTEPPAPPSPHPVSRVPHSPQIEGYELLRELNRGGQGVVYQALQKTTKRKVAIKVLLEGPYASKSAQKRFEREIELVAQLKHPSIITVFHSGTTPDGRPFYVMDYVRGLPLHQYVREKKLALEETLKLFATVCEGVQYAHQKGVIHRDLKPGNILVDADGVPKIMDFGLAKVVTGAVGTLVSLSQQVVGTLPYMSPEQARGNPDEIDTRTDVYALGVILYELLTGHYPYPVVGQLAEVLKHITETPPTPPSRQWRPDSGVTQRKSGRSRAGHCPIDDEVQTIVLRALTKERDRRYQTAGELERDIGHYLQGEPIEARADSGWYVLKKQLRRHKETVAVAIAALFVVGLGAGFVTSMVLWQREVELARKNAAEAQQQRQAAETAAQKEAEARSIADRAKAETQDALAMSKLIQDGLPIQLVDVASHVENLRYFDRFKRKNAANSHLDILDGRIAQEEDELSRKLAAAIERGRLAPVVRRFVEATKAEQDLTLEMILRRLPTRGGAHNLVQELCRELEAPTDFPPPLGRGQEWEDGLRILTYLKPETEARQKAREARRRAIDKLQVVFKEDFSSNPHGTDPSEWSGKHGVEQLRVDGDLGMLHMTSTPSSAGCAYRPLQVPATGPVVTVELTMRLRAPAGASPWTPWAEVCLWTAEEAPLGGLFVNAGRFTYDGPLDRGGVLGPMHGVAVTLDQDYHVELRVFLDRGTFDALVDDTYLVEEAKLQASGPAQKVMVGSNFGTHVFVDHIVCRSGAVLLKRDLGSVVPRTTVNSLGIKPLRTLPLNAQSLVASDFNGDGRTEIAAAVRGKPGMLKLFQVTDSDLNYKELTTRRLESGTALRVHPLIGASFGVTNITERYGPTVDDWHERCAICDVGEDSSIQCVLLPWRDRSGMNQIAPIHYGHGRRGFVLGETSYGRAIELFEEEPRGATERYRRLGYFQPCKPRPDGALRPNDVYSVAPCDWDGDGDDDLFIGWGPWNGYCAALVRLRNGEPVGDRPAVPDQHVGDAQPVVVQPLTGPVGCTQLAISKLGTDTPHLVAISQPSPSREGVTTGQGLRVWRVPDIQLDAETPPSYFEPGDFGAIAAGVLCGRDVFAVAGRITREDGKSSDKVLRIYGLGANGIELLWEAMVYDANPDCQLHFADLTGKGKPEFLVNLGETGEVLVYGAE